MLGITSSEAQGRLIQEAVRNVDVQRFLRDQIKAAKPLEREVTVGAAADAERTLEAHGTLLRGSRGGPERASWSCCTT